MRLQRGDIPPIVEARPALAQSFRLSPPDHLDRRELPVRRRHAYQTARVVVQRAKRGLTDGGFGNDLASVLQPITGAVTAQVIPERTASRQPPEGGPAFALGELPQGLLQRYARHRFNRQKLAMAMHLATEVARGGPHGHQTRKRISKRPQVMELPMYRQVIGKEFQFNPSRRSSSCPCRTGQRIRRATNRCCPRSPEPGCAPVEVPPVRCAIVAERNAEQHDRPT